MIDPEAFEIAFTAVAPAASEIHEDEEAIPPRSPGSPLTRTRKSSSLSVSAKRPAGHPAGRFALSKHGPHVVTNTPPAAFNDALVLATSGRRSCGGQSSR
jgi:hypothetical protein